MIKADHARDISAIEAKHQDNLRKLKDEVQDYKKKLELLEESRNDLTNIVEELKKHSQRSIPVKQLSCPENPIFRVNVENTAMQKTFENLRADLKQAVDKNIELKVNSTTILS